MLKQATFNIFQAENYLCGSRIVNSKWNIDFVLDHFCNSIWNY